MAQNYYSDSISVETGETGYYSDFIQVETPSLILEEGVSVSDAIELKLSKETVVLEESVSVSDELNVHVPVEQLILEESVSVSVEEFANIVSKNVARIISAVKCSSCK